jgi:hypothetical protein
MRTQSRREPTVRSSGNASKRTRFKGRRNSLRRVPATVDKWLLGWAQNNFARVLPGGVRRTQRNARASAGVPFSNGTMVLRKRSTTHFCFRSKVGAPYVAKQTAESGSLSTTAGDARLRVNDRLVSIRDYHTSEVVQAVRTPPGLYITEVLPESFGIGLRRNLLVATLNQRALGPKGAT